MKRLMLLAFITVSACGVDGEPTRPTFDAGVWTNGDKVRSGAAVGVEKGPVNVKIGTFGTGVGISL
ncbi:hypothetical protein [Parasulfitobacter algicola]|uniref:Argininosuccinate lyase n=1 Tax=Parasulfitobacter algicola TaxID=2614809 RepID=A0ABX2IRX4_9RHOB|nr:hypothetical protein [Sulfitobacter algicola]NSX53845.1 hypothetical protein [Sulfitobacter algicola]